ncbi:hypothetical protein CCR75_007713 [Bremia lactucae]|uniref:Uncharacterized protein n=1 Tax=Bremia lactucae TaxID=4779 RepID=A0A976IEA6_BRELC|nr:hypothetical protein CCR75_007713 [Bremia lactucae]
MVNDGTESHTMAPTTKQISKSTRNERKTDANEEFDHGKKKQSTSQINRKSLKTSKFTMKFGQRQLKVEFSEFSS